MQKKLIALAVAGLASTAAFAQSNVTIYGAADATFDNVRATGATAGSGSDFKARNRVTANSSFIGFKGVEDLGNGMKAVFQIENGVNLDNGAAGAWNNRDSYVGVAAGFGTIVAGNLTGPTRALGAKLDINSGATGIGANTALLGKLGGGSGAGAFDQRITNAIAYVSPTIAGFTGVIGYSAGLTNNMIGTTNANGTAAAAAAGNALAGRENAGVGTTVRGNTAWTLGLNYETGPVYVGYAYTAVNASSNGALAADGLLAGVDKLENHRLGAIYKVGSAGQVGFMWDRTVANPTAGSDVKQNVYYLSGKFNVTSAGAIIGQYGVAKDVTASNDTGAKHVVLGYEHSLSKRTVLKAVYSQVNNDRNASYDYLYGVSNANSVATADALTGGQNAKGFSVGVRHSF